MKDNYDFSDAIKNPFANREKGKFNVTINYDCSDDNDSNAEDEHFDDIALHADLEAIAESQKNYKHC